MKSTTVRSGETPDTLWYTRCSVPTAFGLALRLANLHRDMEERGTTMRSLGATADRAVRQAHFDHTQPNFFRQGGNLPALLAFSAGAPLKVIGLGWVRTTQAVYVPATSDIVDPKALKGKRIGIPRRTRDPQDFWRATILNGFDNALRSAGLTLSDVEVVEVVVDRASIDGAAANTGARQMLWGATNTLSYQREELLALAGGDIDALYSEGAQSPMPMAFLGARKLIELGHGPEELVPSSNCRPLTLTVSAGLLRQAPEIVERVVFGPVERQSEERAIRTAKELARAGVIDWSREANPSLGVASR